MILSFSVISNLTDIFKKHVNLYSNYNQLKEENDKLRNDIALSGRKVLEEHYSPKKHGEFLLNKIFS